MLNLISVVCHGNGTYARANRKAARKYSDTKEIQLNKEQNRKEDSYGKYHFFESRRCGRDIEDF